MGNQKWKHNPKLTSGSRLVKEADVPLTPTTDQSGVRVAIKQRKVIPLLPVRYALGYNISRTPNVDGSKFQDAMNSGVASTKADCRIPLKTPPNQNSPFKVTDVNGKAMPLEADTHYTLRRLREGYLYVFSENDCGWRIFKVENASPPLTLLDTYNLLDEGLPDLLQKPTADGMLLVPEGNTLWLSFSDAPWTEKTLRWAQELDEKSRERHMRKFAPDSWKGKPHAAPLPEIQDWVADFAPRMDKDAFWFSQDVYINMDRAGIGYGLKPEELANGAVLALEDPVGIVSDIATMMEARKDAWYSRPDPDCPKRTTEWAFTSYKAIDDLKVFAANRDEADRLDRWRFTYCNQLGTDMNLADFMTFAEEKMPANYQVILKDSREQRSSSWNRYSDNYDEAKRTAWYQQHELRRKNFEKQILVPLAKMHVAWCRSQRFRAYFNSSFDSSHAGSGMLFTMAMIRCYAGVQDKRVCYLQMVKELSQDLTKDNLLGRAIVLNDKTTLKSIQASSPHGGHYQSLLSFTWEDHIAKFQKKVETTLISKKAARETTKSTLKASIKILDNMVKYDHAPEILTKYLGAILGGPMAGITQLCLKNKQCYNTLVAAGVVARAPTIPVKMVGKEQDIYKKISDDLVQWASKENVDIDKSVNNVERMIKSSAGMVKGKEGVNQLREIEQEYLINLPGAEKWLKEKKGAAYYRKLETEKFVKEPSGGGYVKRLSSAANEELNEIMVTPEEMHKLNWKAWEGVSETALPEMKQRLQAAAVPALFRTFMGIIQLGDCFQKSDDMAKFGTDKAKAAYVAGVASLTATIGEGIEKTLGRIPTTGLRFGSKLTKFQTGTRWLGRIGTILGGLLTAYVDGRSAWDEAKKGEYSWMAIYGLSALVGGVATLTSIAGWMVAAEWTTFGFSSFELAAAFFTRLSVWLIVIALVINVILWFLPDDIEKWLDKCTWGRAIKWNPDGRFPLLTDETKALEALATP